MYSYIDHLECTQCGQTSPHTQLSKISACCGKVLFARYDLPRLRREVDRNSWQGRDSNMWRFSELMPGLGRFGECYLCRLVYLSSWAG